jgi:glycosidase
MPLLNFLFRFVLIYCVIACLPACSEEELPHGVEGPGDLVSAYEQYGTPFPDVPEIKDIVLYEVNLRAFSPEGDIEGVINRLDEIKALGVNVIWLMPIHPIGEVNSVNSPYAVKFYKRVGEEYGTLDDLRKLTDMAHQKGMAVIMDWVANHTAWDNEWISKPAWYTQDAEGNIIHPPGTNWLDVADLNYNNTEMREAMIDAMTYWAYEANVDGFRCDYADGVPFDFWNQALDSLERIPDRKFIFFAEGSRNDHFNAGFDLNFGWDFYAKLKEIYQGEAVGKLQIAQINEYSGTPEGKHWVRFTTNHDESAWDATPMTLFNGKEGALAASVAAIFTGGVPLIYGSQEVGTVSNVPFFSNSVINWSANPDMLQAYKEILQLYTDHEAARSGENTFYVDNDVLCLLKSTSEEEFLIITNLRDDGIHFDVPEELENSTWTDAINNTLFELTDSLTLDPYAYLLLIP